MLREGMHLVVEGRVRVETNAQAQALLQERQRRPRRWSRKQRVPRGAADFAHGQVHRVFAHLPCFAWYGDDAVNRLAIGYGDDAVDRLGTVTTTSTNRVRRQRRRVLVR